MSLCAEYDLTRNHFVRFGEVANHRVSSTLWGHGGLTSPARCRWRRLPIRHLAQHSGQRLAPFVDLLRSDVQRG